MKNGIPAFITRKGGAQAVPAIILAFSPESEQDYPRATVVICETGAMESQMLEFVKVATANEVAANVDSFMDYSHLVSL